jgi:hypothetical protein
VKHLFWKLRSCTSCEWLLETSAKVFAKLHYHMSYSACLRARRGLNLSQLLLLR